MIKVDGKTKQLGIIGNPVGHSFSPAMHNYISEALGKNYIYCAYNVEKDELKNAVEGLRGLGFAGVNVTAPYKQDVMPYLDAISEKSKAFDSVNTIVNDGGKLIGYTTDADGFYMSLKREGFNVTGKDVLILGAGGVVRPVASLLAMEGASSVTIVNRTKEKADKIACEIEKSIGYTVFKEIRHTHYDLVINTTSLGMHPNEDKMPPFDFGLIDKESFVADMIYNPAETLFLKEAKKMGAKTLNGLGMLIYQGILAYELFTNEKLGMDFYDKIVKDVFGIDG